MSRVRTIDAAYDELRKTDPLTSVTRSGLRRLVVSGEIPSVRVGVKYLVRLEDVESFFCERHSCAADGSDYERVVI